MKQKNLSILFYLQKVRTNKNGTCAYSAENGQVFRFKTDTFLQNSSVKLIKIFLVLFSKFSHRFSLQFYPVGTIGQPIQDSITNRWFLKAVKPCFYGQL